MRASPTLRLSDNKLLYNGSNRPSLLKPWLFRSATQGWVMFVWHTVSQQMTALWNAFSNLIPFTVFIFIYSILFYLVCQEFLGTFFIKVPEILLLFSTLYFNCPTVFIFGLSPLDACESFIQICCNLTYISAVYGVFLTLVAKLTDWRNDCSRSASPSLLKSIFLKSSNKLVNAEESFFNVIALILQNLNAGL